MTSTTTDHNAAHTKKPNPSHFELMVLLVGLVVMYSPTYAYLSEHIWSKEGQGHGPVMLALTLWLFYKRLPELAALPTQSNGQLAWPLLVFSVLIFAFGRSQDFPELETASQMTLISAMVLSYRGTAGWRVVWFPIVFMIFLIPLPNILVQIITAPLKSAVSAVAESLIYHMGLPIGRTGVMLTIGPYNLMVADACAGLNSIFALEAIGVFYLSVMEYRSKLRNGILALLILPISFVSNVIRVIALVLITYYFGDAIGQGFVHEFAGIFLFMIATAFTIGTDSVLGLILAEKHSKRLAQ
ncbi:MAG: exosortase B [Aquabacterium sp.]|nr:exosortase B [Aquabacterium sp.]